MTLLGLALAGVGAFIVLRTLPRFAAVQADYGFELPAETAWILRNGWLQPMPGCLLMAGGLVGLARRRMGPGLFVAMAMLLVCGVGLLVADWLALLLPELVLV